MPTTPIQGAPYPAGTDQPNTAGDLQALALWAESRVVMGFDSTADRTARVTAPTEGMLSWLRDVNRFEYYDGTGWQRLFPPTVQQVQASDYVPAAANPSTNTYADIPSGTWAPLVFTVPPSGKVEVSIAAFVRNTNTTTATIRAAFRLSGAVTRAADDFVSLSSFGSQSNGTRTLSVSGLTPGASVTVTPVWAASSTSGSSSSQVSSGILSMRPVF